MKNRVGEKYLTTEGYEIEIIEYFGAKNCTIKFDTGNILKKVEFCRIKRKSVHNQLHPSVYGVGYLGVGIYTENNLNSVIKIYVKWKGMLERCYDKKRQETQPTYIGCSVLEEWYNFQNFAKWYEENWKEYMEGWHLDKDILIKGNKIYSPKTCCFVPQEINVLFTKSDKNNEILSVGIRKMNNKFQARLICNKLTLYLGVYTTPEEAFQAYKMAKEKHIKEVADRWKDKIDPRVYQAMYNYQVEIDN